MLTDALRDIDDYKRRADGERQRFSRMQRKAGNLTKDEFDRINRKADKVLDAEREPWH